MRNIRKWAVLLATAATLSAAVVSSPPPIATAAPQPNANAPSTWREIHASHTLATAARMAGKARNSTNTSTLDYRQANTAFRNSNGVHVAWRRQFGAGWLKAGGKISHISSAERRRVQTVERSAFKPRNQVQPLAPNCKGSNRVTNPHNQGGGQFFEETTSYYWDSCRTNKLIAATSGTCVAYIGFGLRFVGKNPWVTALMALGILACTITASQVTAAKSNSSLGAVIFDVTYRNNLISDPWIYARVRPQ